MQCVHAERLRNIALVSISREHRILAKLRDAAIKPSDLSLRKGQNMILLRKRTDQDRKALQDHLTSCSICLKTDKHTASELVAQQQAQPLES